MQRNQIFLTSLAAIVAAIVFACPSSGQLPGGKLPGRAPSPDAAEEEKLPPLDLGKYFYSVGMGTAHDARSQQTGIDFDELRKGIEDGLADSGPAGSYLYGLQFGDRLRKQLERTGLEMDMDQYLAGVRDTINGGVPAVSIEEAQEQERAFLMEILKKKSDYQKRMSDKFFERHMLKPGVRGFGTGSGIVHVELIEPGLPGGQSPDEGDSVTISYNSYYLEGTKWKELAGSDGVPLEIVVGLEILGPGMDYAFEKMTVGSRYRFFIPGGLGIGTKLGGGIPPNTVFMFDVRLHRFVPGELEGTKFPALPTRPVSPRP